MDVSVIPPPHPDHTHTVERMEGRRGEKKENVGKGRIIGSYPGQKRGHEGYLCFLVLFSFGFALCSKRLCPCYIRAHPRQLQVCIILNFHHHLWRRDCSFSGGFSKIPRDSFNWTSLSHMSVFESISVVKRKVSPVTNMVLEPEGGFCLPFHRQTSWAENVGRRVLKRYSVLLPDDIGMVIEKPKTILKVD